MYLFLLSSLLGAAPLAHAWGDMGHETVAFIAQNYVTSETAAFVQNILGASNASYMADVATWADSYRFTHAGRFSYPYHFIDAEDSPPSSCNVDYNRDCGSTGCSISAIANYTSRVKDSSVSSEEQLDAMKFLIHIVGDLHQPLHDEALERGGNEINVKFGGAKTNMHHIWDTNMPEKIAGGGQISDAESWASTLVHEIESGAFKSQSANWLSGINLSDPISTATAWASDANAYVCSVVIPNGADSYTGANLATSYFQSATSTIEMQIAKAGYRLAAWLNLIATGSDGLSKGHKLTSRAEVASCWQLPSAENDFSRAKLARAASSHIC